MGAPKGNHNAVGHDGSNAGAPTLAERLKTGHMLLDDFLEDVDVNVLVDKISKGKYSERDMARLKKLKGDSRLIAAVMNKIFPDLHDITSGGDKLTAINVINYNGDNPASPIPSEGLPASVPPSV
jgi:hypothetical protein